LLVRCNGDLLLCDHSHNEGGWFDSKTLLASPRQVAAESGDGSCRLYRLKTRG